MQQIFHTKMERKDHIKIWIVMTAIMLFCLAGCQAKNIAGMGENEAQAGGRTEGVGENEDQAGARTEGLGKTRDHENIGTTGDQEGAGKTGDQAGNETGCAKTGNNEIPASDGTLKLAVICEEVGGSQKSWIERLVDEYNESHPDMSITIVPFGDAKLREVDKAMAQLSVAIAESDPPDLILLRNITSRLDALVSQGYVEDLTPFAEKSEKVHLEDYYQKVLDCGRKEGVLAVIPKTFAVSTLVTSKKIFDGSNGWTYSQLLDCCMAHGANPLLPTTGPESILFEILRESIDAFVDEDQNKCRFDSEEFKDFLEYVGSYCTWSPHQFEYIDQGERGSALREGKILAGYYAIHGLGELKNIRRDFGDAANFVGFPSKYGTPVYRITMSGDDSFAITSTSNKKEEAWKFMEWYLCKEDEMDKLALCSDRKRMEEEVETAIAGREDVNNGESEMTEEDRETLQILLKYLEPLPDDNAPLYRIVYAEARTYFAGDKTLNEVIDVIQSRATLYMLEK